GVSLTEDLVVELAQRLQRDGAQHTAQALLKAAISGRSTAALDTQDRKNILAVLDDPPPGLEELQSTTAGNQAPARQARLAISGTEYGRRREGRSRSAFTIASAGTARSVSRYTCNSYWPSGFSAHSSLHGARTAERAPMSMMSSCRLPAPASPSRAREGGESGREPRATLARVLAGRRIAPEVTSEGDSPAANSSV